ncbi:MAG: redoxin domain-containing protein [Deltaproteobacteria bacterium]|nr:redoxin domain-containing protein [Deltaproteobacteria bacterium]
MLSIWLALVFLGGVPGLARAGYPGLGKPAPPFVVSSAAGDRLTLDMLRGKVVVMFYESRHVIRQNLELKNELKRLYRAQPDRIKRTIFRLVVINCAEANFVTRPFWKSKLTQHSRKEGFPIYGDWTGSILPKYRLQPEASNFLIIDQQGIIRYYAAGRVNRSRFGEIKRLLSSLVAQ